jgi:hypothetical protein
VDWKLFLGAGWFAIRTALCLGRGPPFFTKLAGGRNDPDNGVEEEIG